MSGEVKEVKKEVKTEEFSPKVLRISDCVFSEPPSVEYVLRGLEVGSVGVMVSAGGVGKSFLALQTAFAVADTTEQIHLFDLVKTRGKVLYISLEDSEPILRRRIHDIGQYYLGVAPGIHDSGKLLEEVDKNLTIYSMRGSPFNLAGEGDGISVEDNIRSIDFLRRKAEGKSLVIVDTLVRCHKLDENSNSQMAGLLKVFERVAEECGNAFLLLHHTNKSGLNGEQEQTSSRGASAVVDNARWLATLSTFSKKDAEKYNIAENRRRGFLKLDIPKTNYSAPISEPYKFARGNGGVLIPIESPKEFLEENTKAEEAL